MDYKTVDRILDLLRLSPEIRTVDVTGGAPELNPNFRTLVREVRKMGRILIDRCNLTALYEKGQQDTPEFLADQSVVVVASLPCYTKDNVDLQRGNGVFSKSIRALKKLNDLGYGKAGTGLELNLVYNPGGAFLPPPQEKLEADYKQELRSTLGIKFNSLYTITNMPIKRFLMDLQRQQKLDEYMQLLVDNFNPEAARGVMCRNLISIAWNGEIFDCDFNQMLDVALGWKQTTLWDIENFTQLQDRKIAFENHCFACTAGAGSSCGGSLAESKMERRKYEDRTLST